MARTDKQTRSLETIAARSGFGGTQSVLSRRAYSPGTGSKISFFLVHHHLNTELMQAVLLSVRSSAVEDVRFAPVVLFAEDGPFEQYLEFIHMGFDDVITLPEKREILVHGFQVKSMLTTFTSKPTPT